MLLITSTTIMSIDDKVGRADSDCCGYKSPGHSSRDCTIAVVCVYISHLLS